MPSDGDSFLPRIQSVFYAVFDVRQGPKIVYQVPEGLIVVPTPAITSNVSIPATPMSESVTPPFLGSATESRNSSSSLVSQTESRSASHGLQSPQKRAASLNRILFNFDDISKYVIPHSALCGRLVICSTQRHRIIGFPINLRGKYQRNYFRYNLCFVFERSADLSCYEPIIRKISRVLTSCEEESGFLSDPQKSTAILAIIEQLYEDLNSYSETSIPIDQFNSIELKIFPFYPNPPFVKDWMVPVALINLSKRIEPSWDLTMVKVCRFIDGTNHVSKIAQLADCDLDLTRQAISHLLYYQVIMMTDIFQYSNMYTLRKSIQWLADEPHVREECGPYVTKPGRPIPDWPKLLHLYSRLKPGKTVFEWMEEYSVHNLNIDVRRFTSFGVIKGFLRRVHRWPILLGASDPASLYQASTVIGLHERSNSTSYRFPNLVPQDVDIPSGHTDVSRGRMPQAAPIILTQDVLVHYGASVSTTTKRIRRASAAEKVLEQLRSRDLQKSGVGIAASSTSRAPWALQSRESTEDSLHKRRSETRRPSITQVPPPSPVLSKATLTAAPARPRLSRSPSAPVMTLTTSMLAGSAQIAYPTELVPLLDGEHHTDELATRFEVGWPLLEQMLVAIGGGQGNGDYGKVSIFYR